MYVQYILIIFSPVGQRQQSPLTEEQLAVVAGQRGWLAVGYPCSSGGSYTPAHVHMGSTNKTQWVK